MKRNNEFTLVDLGLAIAILLMVLLLILPAFSSCCRAAPQMQNSTQMRGIQAGMVLYSQGNNGYYPGLTEDGSIDPAVGLTTQGRITRLIEDRYFSLEYARSPFEVQTQTTSYALLQVNVDPDGKSVPQDNRNAEWRDTENGESIVISDRAVPIKGSYKNVTSVHPTSYWDEPIWKGSVAWNDNHVTFETTSFLPTRYGTKSHLIDALFASPGDAHSGDDAFMVWSGTSDL